MIISCTCCAFCCYHDLPFYQWCLSLHFVTGKFLSNVGPNEGKRSGSRTWRTSPATRVSGLASQLNVIENVEDHHCSVYGNSSAAITQWLFLEPLLFYLCLIWSLHVEMNTIIILSLQIGCETRSVFQKLQGHLYFVNVCISPLNHWFCVYQHFQH
jgi:hypothetical protein